MRRFILSCALLAALSPSALAANSNQSLNVQGVIRDAVGTLQSMPFSIDVNLYAMQTGGTAFYTQHFPTVQVDNGFFSVELSSPTLSFASAPETWVGVQVGGDASELPRQHLAGVPYALSAGTLDATLCSGCVTDGMVATLSASKLTGGSALFVDLTSNQASIAGNKTFTGIVTGAARDVSGTPMKVCSGSTPPGTTAWAQYNNTMGLTVAVDTTGCGFTNTPTYVASLLCDNACWQASGGGNPYASTKTGFTIYVSYPPGATPAVANSYNWHIGWVAIGN
jgi:hypothetical protein